MCWITSEKRKQLSRLCRSGRMDRCTSPRLKAPSWTERLLALTRTGDPYSESCFSDDANMFLSLLICCTSMGRICAHCRSSSVRLREETSEAIVHESFTSITSKVTDDCCLSEWLRWTGSVNALVATMPRRLQRKTFSLRPSANPSYALNHERNELHRWTTRKGVGVGRNR
jgi:hypothetical protein